MDNNTIIEEFYLEAMKLVANVIRYEEAFKALKAEFEKRAEATLRHLFSIDGAMANEVAAMVREHPAFTIRFVPSETGFSIEVTGSDSTGASQAEAEEIRNKIESIVTKYDKLPGLPDKGATLSLSVTESD